MSNRAPLLDLVCCRRDAPPGAACQMVRSGQPTGVLMPMVYLFGVEESKAKNSKVAHEYAEHREHGEFILVRASGE
jgi:hypothetical protein